MKRRNKHHAMPVALSSPLAAAVSPVEPADLPGGAASAPDPQWVRGDCPQCGAPLVSNMYLRAGVNFVVVWECWHSFTSPLGEPPSCNYRREL